MYQSNTGIPVPPQSEETPSGIAPTRAHRRRQSAPKKLTFGKRLELFGLRWFFTLIRRTVRIRVINDRRDQIRYQSDRQFIYAILHAHQVAAVALSDPNTGALVSRSRDGDLLVPLLESCGCVPIRGSSGEGRKGGATALSQLIRHCQQGHPAVIAVDGPKGPRGKVQKGAAMLAQKTGIPILPVVLVARRRWLFANAWDRMQLPIPFCRLDCRFGDPIYVQESDDLAAIAGQVETSLERLEWAEDPDEAAIIHARKPANELPQAAQKAA
ncbi:lysophospholipid acyltransferase family protein [Aporhodopirellula aestuarii]|uniref:Lysophospholipid acyltransferase family protein n=1 Tax=Aporhodopirellula aestuarii TaxID=2950107 RepID=A0ABT0U413_9BACT|nr:lysophospholipid acyltransferase family protein [Aporhodopirellula aestuarii]MCM2371290.1 lysophospholipid acyltransferase family protein [Aporhodopirellula aestuarii]